MGVFVSFTASAGQDSAGDWNVAPLTARARADGGPATLGAALAGDLSQNRALIQSARLVIGGPQDFHSIPDERDPHVDLKPNARNFPEVDRTHKGDPIVAMRPSFDTRLTEPGALGVVDGADLSFRVGSTRTVTTLAPRAPLPEDAAEAVNETVATTQRTTAAVSPAQGASAATPAQSDPALSERAAHGATPAVSRAVALGSSTPAQPDAVPIEVSSFPRAMLAIARGEDAPQRPNYAAFIDQDKMDREKRCLAEAVYFESRSEPEAGQAAVAQVVLNRVSSGLYPASVCGVVYQNRHHYKACQFSFACEGRSLRVTEPEAWVTAVRIAGEVMGGRTYISDVGRSTHYHANYVKPRWARSLKKMDVIGHHIFYKLKPGQT